MPILTHFWPDPGVFAACISPPEVWHALGAGHLPGLRPACHLPCPPSLPCSRTQLTNYKSQSSIWPAHVHCGACRGFENSLSQLPTVKTLGNSHKHPDFCLSLQSLSICRHGAGIPTWPCGAGLEPPLAGQMCLPGGQCRHGAHHTHSPCAWLWRGWVYSPWLKTAPTPNTCHIAASFPKDENR